MKKIILLFSLLLAITFADAQLSGYYKQGFEDTAFPPPGWSSIVIGDNVWHRQADSLYDVNPAAASLATDTSICYLVTPQFAVKAGDSLTFQLDIDVYGGNDTLSVLVSKTGKSTADFTTVLTTYDSNPNSIGYIRKSLGLSAFAGKKIYIAFKHSEGIYGANVFIDDVTIGTPPSKDISALSIDLRTYLSTDSTIVPKATFKNEGSKTQTFDVTLTAGSYTSTKTITSLLPQYTQQVSFDNIVLPSEPADIIFAAYASLSGEENASNDTIKKKCTTIKHFASAGWIKAQGIAGVTLDANAVTCYSSGTSPNDSGFIFSIGGFTGPYAEAAAFNLKTKTWIYQYINLPTYRAQGHAFTYKNKVFYIGGWDGGSQYREDTPFITNEVLIYDATTGNLAYGLRAPVPLGSYAGSQYHDSLYYVIEVDTGTLTNSVYVYNAASDTWATATEFPGIASENMAAGIINNTIITAGGLIRSSFFASEKLLAQSYKGIIDPNDPTKITWTKVEDYPEGAAATIIAASINNPNTSLVYFTGGYDSTIHRTPIKETYAYNVNTDHWERGPDKPTAASYLLDFAPLIFHDTLYIVSIGGDMAQGVPNEWLVIGPVTSGVLAEKLISFTATLQNDKTALNWKVSEDGLGGYYIIQRAADAVHFADISLRTNAGKASGVKSYTGYDELPLKGYNYYRIKTISADGSVSYSAIKAVNNISLSSITARIYPNPTHGLLNVVLQNNNGSDAIISIAISDIAGRRIINENKTVNGSLNLSYNLKPGTYVVNLSSKDGTFKQSRKVVVE